MMDIETKGYKDHFSVCLKVALLVNTKSKGKYHLGLAKTGLNSDVVLVSSDFTVY